MGWLYRTGWTRKDWIEDLTATHHYLDAVTTTLRSCTRGNVLWNVREEVWRDCDRKPLRWIECNLLKSGGGDGWGHKYMDESYGPYYFTCPKSYLAMVPEINKGWREAVRHYHANR
jgi:hypothetical protein